MASFDHRVAKVTNNRVNNINSLSVNIVDSYKGSGASECFRAGTFAHLVVKMQLREVILLLQTPQDPDLLFPIVSLVCKDPGHTHKIVWQRIDERPRRIFVGTC